MTKEMEKKRVNVGGMSDMSHVAQPHNMTRVEQDVYSVLVQQVEEMDDFLMSEPLIAPDG